ncbi:hypothetical protein MGYG_06446 [Nannizzia gypsea CBS 118893]|uniref:Uncharacterized protein n=1 Tax=Arthroderma gypseum (strain ATCC MYA-4604 / CBS 118893) TaxID=535722 RepID=E4UZB8_ARTGP|nr:hypothetical protein MGYG_06446 [Nannizzia gypsea CBS 118893]EFR03448.1 hypothetical protein MGYG_06446 [Nannizzia gypsea CBS 118893]
MEEYGAWRGRAGLSIRAAFMFRAALKFATLTSELVNINNHVHVLSSWCILVQSSDRPGKDLLEIALLEEVDVAARSGSGSWSISDGTMFGSLMFVV